MITYDAKQKEDFIRRLNEEFKDHKVTVRSFVNKNEKDDLSPHLQISEFHWAKPGTGIFSSTYLLRRNGLVVYGDLGEAVYVWSDVITPAFIAGTDYQYFISKHRGIDGHVELYDWDYLRVADKMRLELEDEDPEGRKKKESDWSGWEQSSGSEYEWNIFVNEHESLHHAEAYKWGRGIHYRAMCHWYGFQLAFQQVQRNKASL